MGITGNTKSGEGVRIGPRAQNFLAKRETVGRPKNCGLDATNGLQEKLLAQAVWGNFQIDAPVENPRTSHKTLALSGKRAQTRGENLSGLDGDSKVGKPIIKTRGYRGTSGLVQMEGCIIAWLLITSLRVGFCVKGLWKNLQASGNSSGAP